MTFGISTLGVSKLTHGADFAPIETGSRVAAIAPATKVSRRTKHVGAGLPTLVIYARFIAWALEQAHFPMPEQVSQRFNCSRATSHRWLSALEEAYGVDRPRRGSSGKLLKTGAA